MKKTLRIVGMLAVLAGLTAPVVRCEDLDTLMKQAKTLSRDKTSDQAVLMYLKIAEAYPTTPQATQALLSAGKENDRRSRIPQATSSDVLARKDKYRKLIEEAPESPKTADSYLYLGQDYMWQGPTACRIANGLFEKAFSLATEDWLKAQSRGRIGQCMEYMGDKSEAQKLYKEVVEKYPNTAWAEELRKNVPGVPGYKEAAGDGVESWMAQANKLFQDKKYEQALALYLQVAEKDTDKDSGYAPNALLMAGMQYDWLAKEKQDASYLEKEKEVLERLIKKYPASSRVADAYLYLGQIDSGDVGVAVQAKCKAAIPLYEKAIKTADRDWIKAQAKGRIGQCLERTGKKTEARAAYQEVLARYPTTPWADEVKKLLSR